jgi:hypothetical protein
LLKICHNKRAKRKRHKVRKEATVGGKITSEVRTKGNSKAMEKGGTREGRANALTDSSQFPSFSLSKSLLTTLLNPTHILSAERWNLIGFNHTNSPFDINQPHVYKYTISYFLQNYIFRIYLPN